MSTTTKNKTAVEQLSGIDFYTKYLEKADENIAARNEELDREADEQRGSVNTQVDNQIRLAEDDVTAKSEELNREYNDIIDSEALQRELNRRQISEAMANMGLTRSGLNATQQTAIQLSAGNAMAKARVSRQEAVDSLTKSLAEYKMQMESKRTDSLNSIDSALSTAKTKYKNELYEAAYKQGDADRDAALKQAEAIDKANLEAAERAAAAANAGNDTIEKAAKALYDSGDITATQYAQILTGQKSLSDFTSGSDGGVVGSRNTTPYTWSWRTASYKKTKDTFNWGGGIDNNDEVTYYDENGVMRTITLKELYNNLLDNAVSEDDAETFVTSFNDYEENTEWHAPDDSPFERIRKEAQRTIGGGKDKKDEFLYKVVSAYASGEISERQMEQLMDVAGITESERTAFANEYSA